MGPWFTALFSAESAAVLAFVALSLVVNLTVRMHLASKQNAREHAELRKAGDRNAAAMERITAAMERNAAAMERNAEGIDRQADSTECRFDSIDRKLDLILSLLRNRSDRDD